METSHLRNQEELVREYAARHTYEQEETELEEVNISGARKLHLLNKQDLGEILLLICKLRPVITEIKWSLLDDDGELLMSKKDIIRFNDKTLENIHISIDARLRIASLLASHILQEDIVAVRFRTGQRYLEVVKGERKEGQMGKTFISSMNPFAY